MGSVGTKVNIRTYPILFVLLVASVALPYYAEAGVFSFITHLFSSEVSAEAFAPNSQNMPLLQAALSPDPNSTTTKDLAIVDGTYLASDTSIPEESKNSSDSDLISIYVVHQGDTLPAIAKMFGVTVNTIRWANDLSGNTISVGQTLVILPISGIQHKVKSGDTLQSIAKQHKGDLAEILQYNNLKADSKLAVGDIVFIPDGEALPASGSTSGGSSGSSKKNSMPVYDGYYMRPIIGGVKTQGIHGHNGVDLASSYGSNILAAADGDVIVSRNSGWNGGYGSYIVIRHDNGTQTLYAHLSGTAVSAGQHVTQGQVIGYMGNSGQVTGHTGIHLHFEVRGARNPF